MKWLDDDAGLVHMISQVDHLPLLLSQEQLDPLPLNLHKEPKR